VIWYFEPLNNWTLVQYTIWYFEPLKNEPWFNISYGILNPWKIEHWFNIPYGILNPSLVLRGDDFITGDCIVQTQHFKYVTFKCRFLLLSPGFKHLLVPVKMRRFNLPYGILNPWKMNPGSIYHMVFWTLEKLNTGSIYHMVFWTPEKLDPGSIYHIVFWTPSW
jgi:hypothetical protein